MREHRLTLAAGVAIGALVFGALAAFAGGSAPELTATATATGTLEPAEEVNVDFASTGRISAEYVTEGEQVAKNEPLAQLDRTEARANVRSAEAALASARAHLLQLRQQQTPAERRQNDVARQRSDIALGQARAALRAAQSQVHESTKS